MSNQYLDLLQNVRLIRHPKKGTIHAECELVFITTHPEYIVAAGEKEGSVKLGKSLACDDFRFTVRGNDVNEIIETLTKIKEALESTDDLMEGVNTAIIEASEEEE